MYAYLYDSMIAWYSRRNVGAAYIHWYAATTLTAMAVVNIASIVVLFAHWHYRWADKLLALGEPWEAWIALGLALLAAHFLYSRWRRTAGASTAPRSRWVAGIYILASVVVFLYASTLASPPHSPQLGALISHV